MKFFDALNNCGYCNKIHKIEGCEKFSKLTLSERWDKVRQFKLCSICIKKNGNFKCSDAKCPIEGCEARHNKLLHKFQIESTVTAHSSSLGSHALFKIVPVTIYNKNKSVQTFAFFDDGSNVTLLEKGL